MKAVRASFVLLLAALSLHAADWPAWRGADGQGVSSEKNLPVTWSRTENVKWRVELPEPGNSTPIVWGDRIFLTQPVGKQRALLCLDRRTGKQIWRRDVETRLTDDPTHSTNPYCSSSPVTDGERVIVWHGSDGLHCYDLNGKPLWKRELGLQRHIWGYGSSPVIHGDLCYLNFGPGDRSFLIALDKKSGKEVWRHLEDSGYTEVNPGKGRDSKTYIGSWTTPVIMKVDGREQLLVSWPNRLVAHEPKSGSEFWTCAGLNPLCYTSPIHSDGVIVAMGGFSGSAIAVRTGGVGDVTESHRLWQHPRTKQRIGSGVIHDGHIYVHNDPGVAECFELKTGRLVWEERLKGSSPTGRNWSSVTLADGKCYTITQGGECFVFRASPTFEQIAANSLGEPSNSSIVPAHGDLFIRTHQALWCIGKK
jgi:outer membrane protein assembly factor BamB